jgi:hypothetical protein
MSSGPLPGDEVPDSVLEELIDAIEEGNRLFPRRLLVQALDYARQHLSMEHPTEAALWDYVVERLRHGRRWRYANLDDFPHQFGYALRDADGRGLYLKLRFNDDSWAVLMSFHD